MDPNATLAQLREYARLTLDATDRGLSVAPEGASDMAELFEALDTWITRGGFLPDAWKGNNHV